MKRRLILKMSIVALLAMGLNGCGSGGSDKCNTSIDDNKSIKEYNMTAFYSDPMLERSLAIDLKTMSIREEIYSTGENTYNVDILDRNASLNKVFVMTRGSNSVDVINTKTLKPKDYGGSNATGHPCWVSQNQFLLTDRENRTVELFKVKKDNGIWSAVSQDKIETTTSIHHFIREGVFDTDITRRMEDFNSGINTFYGVTEGSHKEKIAPSIVQIIPPLSNPFDQ